MVKAKDFWNYLCEELDYRFFAGVACPELVPLYKKMDSNIMHYVPAANERIALGLVSGAHMSGFKSGLLMDMRFGYDLTSLLMFNVELRIPFLTLGFGDEDSYLVFDYPRAVISDNKFKEKIAEVVSKMEEESVPGLIVFEGGVL